VARRRERGSWRRSLAYLDCALQRGCARGTHVESVGFTTMSSDRGLIRPVHSKLVLAARLADAGWIAVTHFIAFSMYEEGGWEPAHTVATGAAVIAFLFAAEGAGLYQAFRGVPLPRELMKVFTAWAIVATMLLFAAFALKSSENFSRVITVSWFIAAPIAISIWRVIVRLSLQELRKRGRNTRRVAIIGCTEMAERVSERIHEAPWLGMTLVGIFDDRSPDRCHQMPAHLGRHVGSADALVEKARRGEIDLVYVALPLRAEPRVNAILRKLADTTASVYFVPDFFAFDLLHGQWSSLDDIPVVSIFETPFYGVDGWVKRLEDIVLGIGAVCVAGIPMLIIAALIKLTSKGPVFFKQKRYGLNGEVIPVLKFRTMTVSEDGDHVKQATKNDARITPLGAILRRTSLDELPQLFHVVTGSMSLVGPRPHAVAHNEAYRGRIHGYMLRHKVKPGLTGWAQVNGWRGETDTLEKMEKRVAHDLEYIRRWGLMLDIKIIALTMFSSRVHRNAY
jgi:putative colanic acid biosynthesis UDP-glucose lipid carrier transferase